MHNYVRSAATAASPFAALESTRANVYLFIYLCVCVHFEWTINAIIKPFYFVRNAESSGSGFRPTLYIYEYYTKSNWEQLNATQSLDVFLCGIYGSYISVKRFGTLYNSGSRGKRIVNFNRIGIGSVGERRREYRWFWPY